jgi:hypothetical protein
MRLNNKYNSHSYKSAPAGSRLIALICAATILFGTAGVHANTTVQAKSGSREDIQAAINAAPENGTVVIPQGTFDFRGGPIDIRKNITISGSGNKGTTIKKQSPMDFIFNVFTEGFFRLTNIVLDGDRKGGGVQLRSDNLNFRVDNSTIKNFETRGVMTHGTVKGLIDNNRFEENAGYDVVVYGDNDRSWNRPVTLGTDDAVYIEDNLFTHKTARNSHSIASNRGSRYVFRYNTIDNGNQNTNPIDAHGNWEYGRGSRSYEIYGNKVNSGHSYMGAFIRGGTGVIFDNEFKGSFTHPLVLENYRSFNVANEQYPSIDQINNLHIWNNKANGNEVTPFIHDRGRSREHIQHNRDYFTKKNENYTAFTYPHPMRNEGSVDNKSKKGFWGSVFGFFKFW